jgi:hypothetical protein
MSELTSGQLIKIIIGILVFAVVILGVYFLFRNRIADFFNGLPTGQFFRSLI